MLLLPTGNITLTESKVEFKMLKAGINSLLLKENSLFSLNIPLYFLILRMKKELGKWLMDIAKYITTAVLLSSLFSNRKDWEWYLYFLLVLAVLVTLIIGLLLNRDKEE